MKNIIGFYKDYILFVEDGVYYVAKRREAILYKGTEEEATKMFIMLAANFIDEEFKIEA